MTPPPHDSDANQGPSPESSQTRTTGSRRHILKQTGAIAFGTTMLGSARGSAQSIRTFEFESNGEDKVATYRLRAPGKITLERGDGNVDLPYAYGHVGPKTGHDEYVCEEDPVGIDVAGPANVYLDGSRLVESSLPRLDDTITADDVNAAVERTRAASSETGPNTITFTAPRRITAYEMVSQPNSIRPTDNTKADVGNRPSVGEVQSHIGPTSGTDTYVLDTDLYWFNVVGDCDVLVNDEPIETPPWWS